MAVAYHVTGAGGFASQGFNTSVSCTMTLNPTVTNTTWLIGVGGRCGGQAGNTQTVTCTATGVTFTKLGATMSVGSEEYLAIFTATVATTGSRTITLTCTGGSNTGRSIRCNGEAFTGVGAISSPVINSATSGVPTLSMPAATSNDMYWGFFEGTGSGAIAGFNGTQRYTDNDGGFMSVLMGDSANTINPLTCGTRAESWGAMGVALTAPVTTPTNQFFSMF